MRKLSISLLTSIILVGSTLPYHVSANSNVTEDTYQNNSKLQDNSKIKASKELLKKFAKTINYDTALNRDGLNKKQLINQFLSYGDTQEKAEYYARLDILVAEVERSNIEIDYTGAKLLDDEYVRTHPDDIEKGIFELNPDVWLTQLESNTKTRLDSDNDLKTVQRENADFFLLNKDQPNAVVKIKYPDGSVFTSSSEITNFVPDEDGITADPKSRVNNTQGITTQATISPSINGPWVHVSNFEQSKLFNSGVGSNKYISEWSQTISRSTVINVLKFQVKNNGSSNGQNWTTSILSVEGDATGGGVIAPNGGHTTARSSSTTGNYATGGSQYVMGYTKGSFLTSGNFSAGIQGFGLSFTANQIFSQYSIQQLTGSAILTTFNGAS